MCIMSCFKCVHNTSITSPKGPFNSLIILIAWVRVLCVVVAHYTFHIKFITISSSFLWHSPLNGHWNMSVHVVVTQTSVPVNVHIGNEYFFYNNCRNPRALIGSFLLSISGQTHEIYNLCNIDATSESRKFEKSICHFLTNRKRPFLLLLVFTWRH